MVPEDTPPPRIKQSGGSFARLLLESAKLDQPSAERKRLFIERELAAHHAAARGPRLLWGAFAAAVVIGLYFAGTSLGDRAILRPDRVATSATAATLTSAQRPPEPVQHEPERQRASNVPACATVTAAAGTSALIDDMEDGDARLLDVDGRNGQWNLSPDASILPTAIQPARAGSNRAFHVRGEPGKAQGLLASLLDKRIPGGCYDASRYQGLQFWARGAGRIYIKLSTVDTMSEQYGGFCSENCYDAHQQPINLTAEWQLHRVLWHEFEQAGWGKAQTFDPARLISVDFAVSAADGPFEFWIDDVSFLEP